jgi:hypothetical protein
MQAKDEKCFAVALGTPASLIKPQMTDGKEVQIVCSDMEIEVAGKGQRVVLESEGTGSYDCAVLVSMTLNYASTIPFVVFMKKMGI